jgi:hypothetical protein
MKAGCGELDGTLDFGFSGALVGGRQVVFDAHSECLCDLLLVRSCAVGEALSFSIFRDKDGLLRRS